MNKPDRQKTTKSGKYDDLIPLDIATVHKVVLLIHLPACVNIPIAKISLTSPFEINVPTKDLSPVETKSSFVLVVGTFDSNNSLIVTICSILFMHFLFIFVFNFHLFIYIVSRS